jgi:hypothetical protein
MLVNEQGKAVKYIDTLLAYDEKHAEKLCYETFGVQCKYTIWNKENFKAIKC